MLWNSRGGRWDRARTDSWRQAQYDCWARRCDSLYVSSRPAPIESDAEIGLLGLGHWSSAFRWHPRHRRRGKLRWSRRLRRWRGGNANMPRGFTKFAICGLPRCSRSRGSRFVRARHRRQAVLRLCSRPSVDRRIRIRHSGSGERADAVSSGMLRRVGGVEAMLASRSLAIFSTANLGAGWRAFDSHRHDYLGRHHGRQLPPDRSGVDEQPAQGRLVPSAGGRSAADRHPTIDAALADKIAATARRRRRRSLSRIRDQLSGTACHAGLGGHDRCITISARSTSSQDARLRSSTPNSAAATMRSLASPLPTSTTCTRATPSRCR